ncbi:uncharacterized protein LOC111065403 [Drosophila obscura]|uniref:uncharacterized protein LOC111065403 n=1 Tax=Drosophila obscura TaxID=7282 RepID=UPI001BB2A65D|nr:uncharacterized protein LOC111065403 [Drosophila obscura]
MDEDSSCSSSSGSGSDKPKTHSKSTSTEDSLGVSTTSSTWTILPSDRIEAVMDKLNSNEEEEPKDPGEFQSGDPEDKHENDRCNLAVVDDSQADDISDGISIISDCESTDRISPHPFLRDTLADLNFNELLNTPLRLSPRDMLPPLPPPPPPPHRQRRHKHTETEPYVEPELNLLQQETKLEALYRMYPLMQNGLTAVFYVAATLAILGFIGRLQHPEWPGLGNDKPIAELERRLGELEMSNNLMRAEIDIMSKQLQYLSSGQGPAYAPDGGMYYSNAFAQDQDQGGMGKRQGKQYKKFKAWPGLGNSMEPLDITKEDLKKPHKCRDGQYVQVASMCLESPLSAPESLADEIGEAVHDVLQQSQTFRNFEKVTEKLGTLGTGGVEGDEGDASTTNEARAFHPDGRQQTTGNGNPNKQPNKPKVDRYNDKYSPNASKDRYNDKYNPNHSHEAKRDNSRGRSKEDDHSKEQNNNNKRRYNDDASMKRERFNKNGKKQRHHANSGERDESDGSGEWHEKRMQQREQSRHKHDQKRKDNSNWYIERGDGREQARSSEAGR